MMKASGGPLDPGAVPPDGVVDVWEALGDDDVQALTLAALDRTRAPTFCAKVLSATGDTVGLQVIDGLPSGASPVVYVQYRGTFEVLRVERWPAASGQRAPRVLLKLRAWPMRQS